MKETNFRDDEKTICVQITSTGNTRDISLEKGEEHIEREISDLIFENDGCEDWEVIDQDNTRLKYENYHSFYEYLIDIETLKNSDYDDDLICEIMEIYDLTAEKAIEFLDDNYEGEYKSDEDFALNLLKETSQLNELPENLRSYFNYESYARDKMITDYDEYCGHYYRRG